MPDLARTIHATMRALVQRYGCYDAVAEVINSRFGAGCSKGTISKKMAGHLDWTLKDVIALQDGVGHWPVTRLLARQLEGRDTDIAGCVTTQSGVFAKESGEAIAAILAAEQSHCANDEAQAIVEAHQAMAALRALLAILTAPKDVALGGQTVPLKGPVK